MNLTIDFKDELDGISTWIAAQFERTIGQIKGIWNREHNPDGSHTAITATSVTVAGPVSITGTTGTLTVSKGGTFGGPIQTTDVSAGVNGTLNNLNWFAGLIQIVNASIWGPGVRLGDGNWGWGIVADHLNAGVSNAAVLRWVPNVDSAAIRYAMQLTQDPAAPVAGEYYLTPNANVGVLYLGSKTFGAGYRITNIFTAAIEASRALSTGEHADTAIGGATQNNYAIWNTSNYARLGSGTTNVAFTGFVAIAGMFGVIFNAGTFNIDFNHQNAGSTAANRIITSTGATVTIVPGQSAFLRYDSTASRWILLMVT